MGSNEERHPTLTCSCEYTYIPTYPLTRDHMHICARKHEHVHTCVLCTHTNTHMNTCLQTQAHTNTLRPFSRKPVRDSAGCGRQVALLGGGFVEGLAGMELARLSACFPPRARLLGHGTALHQLSRHRPRHCSLRTFLQGHTVSPC